MAPVTVETYFECYNFSPKQLEDSLHGFFGDSQLSVDVYDVYVELLVSIYCLVFYGYK